MKRLALPLAALTLVGLWLSAGSRPANACSTGPDFDAVRDSEVIVAGRIIGWELIENVTRWDHITEPEPYDDPNYYGPYDPIRVGMSVSQVLKGSAPSKIDLVAGNTLLVQEESGEDRYSWVGTHGACGAFSSDPTDMYAILGLRIDDFGRYHPSLPLAFFIGPEPPGSFDDPRLAGLAPLLPGSLPSAGGTPLAGESTRDTPWLTIALGAAVAGAGVAATTAWLAKRRLRP